LRWPSVVSKEFGAEGEPRRVPSVAAVPADSTPHPSLESEPAGQLRRRDRRSERSLSREWHYFASATLLTCANTAVPV